MWKMSGVLQFYDLVSTGSGSSSASVTGRCRECGKTIKGFRNITSNFVTHLRNVHKRVYEAYDLTRPHKGTRKRRSNASAYEDSATCADDPTLQNSNSDEGRVRLNDDETATKKRPLDLDKRVRKVVPKRELPAKQEPPLRAGVQCGLADCLALRCDEQHAAIARFCVATNAPMSLINSAPFRSSLHTAFSSSSDPSPSISTLCVTCGSVNDVLVATYLRARAKLRTLLSSGDSSRLNVTFDLVQLSPPQSGTLVGATLNFVQSTAQTDSFLYTVTAAVARVPRDEAALNAFARLVCDRLCKLAPALMSRSVPIARVASISSELDAMHTIARHRNVSFLHMHSSDTSNSHGWGWQWQTPANSDRLLNLSGVAHGETNDLTALRCFQSRVERALNEAIRVTTRDSDVFDQLRRCVAALRAALDRAHRSAVCLLHVSSTSRSNGDAEADGDADVDSEEAQNESQLRAFVNWLKTLRVLDAAATSASRWNAEMKTLRRLLDAGPIHAALLRRVADVDLGWFTDPSASPDAAAALREFVGVVQPFEEVLDVLDASGQISVSLAVPCLFGFDSHLNDVDAAVRYDTNRTLVRHIRANLHAEFAFVFRVFDGSNLREAANKQDSLRESERRVVQTLLSGTLLDPRFKATCFDETAAHKAVAVSALRNMLAERESESTHAGEAEREMDEYLEEDIIAQVNDPLRVLEFWRANAARWPSLYRLATELLTVPATRSPFQRALSELVLDAQASGRADELERIANVEWNWLEIGADDNEADVQFSEAKRFALKCNLALLDHSQLFSA